MKQTNDNLTIINDLQKEIECLKNILDREGISYQEELDQLKKSTSTETNQGSRIVFPNEITKDMTNRFFARFWGRTDVYAKRVENKKNEQGRILSAMYQFLVRWLWQEMEYRVSLPRLSLPKI